MRWKGRRQSTNVDDRRGMGGGRRVAVGGGCVTVVILVLALLLSDNPLQVLQQIQPELQQTQTQNTQVPNSEDEELSGFVRVVLADTEDVWNQLFAKSGSEYQEPRLVIFASSTRSACGFASAASGPFYCPADQQVYIDLAFYGELKRRFQAPGDFAMAYVIAHEVGHHVQNLMGITDQVHALRERLSEAEYNQYSVRLELQADFFAGVWAHHADRMNDILQEGDIEEALNAANAIGDDTIQKRTQGYVVPDGFTHGTSAQRMRWFRKGFETGDLSQGDTFEAVQL